MRNDDAIPIHLERGKLQTTRQGSACRDQTRSTDPVAKSRRGGIASPDLVALANEGIADQRRLAPYPSRTRRNCPKAESRDGALPDASKPAGRRVSTTFLQGWMSFVQREASAEDAIPGASTAVGVGRRLEPMQKYAIRPATFSAITTCNVVVRNSLNMLLSHLARGTQ